MKLPAELVLVQSPPARPLLVFDGDCGFCRYWIARWRRHTGDQVDYQPFQDPQIAARFPEIPHQHLSRSVQLIEPDGRVREGALAVLRALAHAGRGGPLWCYERLPGFAVLAEATYRIIADHRSFASRVTTLLWGKVPRPSTYTLTTWIFLKLIGVVYLIAFWSMAVQIRGLAGRDGILPAAQFMAAVRAWANTQQIGMERFRVVPTLFWLGTSDGFLQGLCIAGAVLAALLIAGFAPAVLLPMLWVGYLSLVVICRPFLWYQWDTLLLETGLLAILVAPFLWRHSLRRLATPPRLGLWLLWWLLFRLMFGSGVVKLASGDPTWRSLTALTFHFETQPLPTPVAWYAHLLPIWLQKASTAGVLGVELIAPWLIFAPRRLGLVACGFLAGLQGVVWLTGNYTFFNLLALTLCLSLVDDAVLERIAPILRKYSGGMRRSAVQVAQWPRVLLLAVAVVTVPVSVVGLMRQLRVDLPGSSVVAPLSNLIAPFESVNTYGLFAVMTTTRPEIIVEGSNDGAKWLAYEFKDKPGDVSRRPPWVAPHQPRLDWQMWFAALGDDDLQWFERFCQRLLEGSPAVLQLLAYDPFAGHPPRYVRGVLYQYHFADAAAHRQRGVWWTRERMGLYSPVFSRRGVS